MGAVGVVDDAAALVRLHPVLVDHPVQRRAVAEADGNGIAWGVLRGAWWTMGWEILTLLHKQLKHEKCLNADLVNWHGGND